MSTGTTAALVALLIVVAAAVVLIRRRVVALRPFAKNGFTAVVDTKDPDGRPVRVLKVNGTWQSATYLGDQWLELVFPYHKLFDCMFRAHPQPKSVLMLGGGGYAYPKHLIATHPDVSVDVVENDPAVVQLAFDFFFVDSLFDRCDLESNRRLTTHVADARTYVDGCTQCYDAVVNDVFAAADAPRNLVDDEGSAAVKRILKPGGLYLVNAVTAFSGSEAERAMAIFRGLSSAFAHVYAIPCSEVDDPVPDNIVFVATDQDLSLENAIQMA